MLKTEHLLPKVKVDFQKVVSKRIGYSNTVLVVNGSSSILVDTGVKRPLRQFRTFFKQYNLHPEDIRLIVLTHTHYDHTGNLSKLKKLTGAKVLVHKNEVENLKNGFTPIPKGQGKFARFVSNVGRTVYPHFASPEPFIADLVNEDEFELKEFEIDGKVISTPGHSEGSQALLLGKKLISGDTFVNMRRGKIFPPFADDPKTLLKTWQKLFGLGIEEIYPGHGKPFHVKKAFPEFEKWKQVFTESQK